MRVTLGEKDRGKVERVENERCMVRMRIKVRIRMRVVYLVEVVVAFHEDDAEVNQ